MNDYFYKAMNTSGKLSKGIISASSNYELIKKLRNDGFFVYHYKMLRSRNNPGKNRGIKKFDIAVFCKQLSVTLQCGIPLIEALELLAFQSTSRSLREALGLLIIEIRSGESFFNGLYHSKYKFPEFMLYMIEIGEESGRLPEILKELSNYYERDNKINKKIINELFYPTTIFIISIIISIVLIMTVVPSLTSSLVEMGGTIPTVTMLVMSFSLFLKSNIISILMLSSLTLCGLIFYTRYNRNDIYKTIFLKLPMIGTLYRKIIQIKFSRAFSLLFGSGMNLIPSLLLITKMLGNRTIQMELEKAVEEIKTGKGIYEAMLCVESFDPLLMSMIKIGEETGELDNLLRKFAEVLEEGTYDMIMRLTDFIQPIMIIFIAIIVGVIMISVMLPMVSIIDTAYLGNPTKFIACR